DRDSDRVAEQRFIYADGLIDHRLDRYRVRIVGNRSVERCIDNQPSSTSRRGGHYVRITTNADRVVSTHSVVVGCAWAQPAHMAARQAAHLQVLIPAHVAAKGAAGGDVQPVAGRSADAIPIGDKTA